MEEDNPGVLKQGANVALGALETYGKGVDYLNDQVSLRTLQQSTNPAIGLVNKFVPQTEPEWLTNLFDYSYKDLRDDVSEGVGWTAKKVTGSETAGNVAELGTQILLPDAVDFAAGGLPIGAAGKLKFLNVFKRGSKTANKYVDASTTIKDVSRLNKVGDIIGNPNLASESGAIHLLSKTDNLDGIFVKGSNSDLSYKRIAKDYRLASGAGLDLPVVEGYKAANPKTWNKYVLSETKHWAQHGKGSGKYFTLKHATDPTQNIRYRLDNKGRKVIDGKTIDRSFSIKNLKHKKIENLTQQDRIQILKDTTLDSATVSAVMKLTPGGRIMHHAAPVKSTGKIREAFFKANPNLTQADWIPIQRRVEKELGIAFGDSPLNQRYPKTIAEHNEYHKLLDDAKLYPRQLKFPKGLSPNDAYLKLKELGTTVLEIDKKIGVKPTYTSKSIGKQFGNR